MDHGNERLPDFARPLRGLDTVCIPLFPHDFPGERPLALADGSHPISLHDDTLTLETADAAAAVISLLGHLDPAGWFCVS